MRRLRCRGRTAVSWFAALLLGIAATCISCESSPGLTVKVVANRLVDANGQPIRLLGVDRSGTEYACIEGLGIFAGPTGKRAIATMASWDITAVRLPLNEDCWLGINGAPALFSGVRYRAAILAFVHRLHMAGLYVVLDLHWNAPGTALATSQQPMADADHAPAFWSSVARTFAADPAVIFDLYNEPNGISRRCWREGCVLPAGWRTAGMQSLVDAVRSAGAEQPIIATGLDWGNDLSSWLRYRPHDPAHQLVAGLHVYNDLACSTVACWNSSVLPVAGKVPVVAAELGDKTCYAGFVSSFMSWADSVDVSYLGWSWNPTGCAGPALISSWEGRPTSYGEVLRTHLTELRSGGRGTGQ
jgi:aryl-phospho-beta-D-glucosidase BglC (GH1 family)